MHEDEIGSLEDTEEETCEVGTDVEGGEAPHPNDAVVTVDGNSK